MAVKGRSKGPEQRKGESVAWVEKTECTLYLVMEKTECTLYLVIKLYQFYIFPLVTSWVISVIKYSTNIFPPNSIVLVDSEIKEIEYLI